MLTEEQLAQEFSSVVSNFYPTLGRLLQHCYIKVITSYWGNPPRRIRHVGVYCPDRLFEAVRLQQDALREVAQDMGLADTVCLNAARLLHDPMSTLKNNEPRFWLELHWIVSHHFRGDRAYEAPHSWEE